MSKNKIQENIEIFKLVFELYKNRIWRKNDTK